MARGINAKKYTDSRTYYSGPREWYDCKICKELDDFLAAPDRWEWRYKVAEPGRKHLNRRLSGLDCSSYTEDRNAGSPFTLVMEKNDRSYKGALYQWEYRCKKAQDDFAAIGDEKLRIFLGDNYDGVM
ncbi:MAG: hypothetical protein Q9184_005076 [Pyrenodesmia sp. 2 TL-2023]